MPRLDDATGLYLGSTPVKGVYLGAEEVWSPGTVVAASAVPNSTSEYSNSLTTNTFQWTHSVPSGISNQVLLVWIANSGSGYQSHAPTSVTWAPPGGGTPQALTKIFSVETNTTTPRNLHLYARSSPAAGTNGAIQVQMNTGSPQYNVVCIADHIQNAHQTNTFGTPVPVSGLSGTTATMNIPSSEATDLLYAGLVARTNNGSPNFPDAGSNYQGDHSWSLSTYLSLSAKAGGGAKSFTFNWPHSNVFAGIAIPIHGAVVASGSGGGSSTQGNPDWDYAFAATYGSFTRSVLEGFDTDAAEGAGEPVYGTKLDMYPQEFKMTNQSGSGADYYGNWTNVSFHDSCMDLRLYIDNQGRAVGSAPELIRPNGSKYQLYGRYVFEVQVIDPEQEWKVAWLLWNMLVDNGTMGWPAGGEFDFWEGNITDNMAAFHHWYNATQGNQQDYWPAGPFGTGWHLLECEWTPNLVRVLIDEVEIGRRDASTPNGGTSRIVDDPMRCALQTEVELGGGNPTQEAHILVNRYALYDYTG